MRKATLQVSALTAVILVLGCNNQADADWQGAYLYEHEVGVGAGGVTSFIEYHLTLGKDDKCALAIVGLQTDEQISCTTKAAGDSIAIEFKSYADGAVKNAYDVAVYPVGSMLFSLAKEKDVLTTRWQILVPDGIQNTSGQYFARVKGQ